MFEPELQRVDIFRDLASEDLRRLSKLFVEVGYPANHVVFDQGERAEAFYVVKSGGVMIFRDVEGEPVEILARLGEGDHFGEFGIYDEIRRSAAARTTEASRILEIKRQDLLQVFTHQPTLALRLQSAAARRHATSTVPGLGRRREVRTRVNRQVVVMLPSGLSVLCRLVNLSRGGLCLKGVPSTWKVGREERFHLGIGSSLVELQARICWIRDETVGVSFVDRIPGHDMKIQWALRQLAEPMAEAAASPGWSDNDLELKQAYA